VKSSLTGIERPMIVAVHFIFVKVVKAKGGAENDKARSQDKFRKGMNDPAQDRIRKVGEQCTGMEGFLIFRLFGGGTWAGFGSLLLGLLLEILARRASSNSQLTRSPRCLPRSSGPTAPFWRRTGIQALPEKCQRERSTSENNFSTTTELIMISNFGHKKRVPTERKNIFRHHIRSPYSQK
jgi:hypothetical protein